MENIKTFLETASINGLAHIASTRRNIRVFWVTVVVSGFIASGVMIKESFQSWAESPVKTTIETFPITEITFPKVTVCPPKNTFTDLNHDLMVAENITLTNDTRHDLNRLAIELLYEDLFEEFFRQGDKEAAAGFPISPLCDRATLQIPNSQISK